MKLWRRLLYYGLGVALGVLMVKFIFGGRSDIQCNYFPNDRVLYDIRNKERLISDEFIQKLNAVEIDTSDISDLLLMGKVDFKRSNTKADSCKTYWISHTPESKQAFTLFFQNCDSLATVLDVELK